MLSLILGRSGYGKTYHLINVIKELLSEGDTKIMLIVPEQCSFNTEKWILNKFEGDKAQAIEIYSFTRLAFDIIKETQNQRGKRLSDAYRTVLMGRAVKNVTDELVIYKKNSSHIDFITEMIEIFAELKSALVKYDELLNIELPQNLDTLKGKTHDIALIYKEFERLLSEGFVDPLDDLNHADILLDGYDFFKDYTVILDEFSGFSAQEFAIIRKIFCQAKNVYCTACTDTVEETDGGYGLFSPVKETVASLVSMAAEEGVQLAENTVLTTDYRHKNNEALKYVDQNIFRFVINRCADPSSNITLYCADTVYDECEFTAKEIHRLIRQENLRARDFTVIVREIDDYRGILDNTFERFEISYHMDIRENIETMPLIALVSSLFNIVVNGYKTDDILRYIKTGILGLDPSEIADFENYLFTWRINGKAFKSDFTGHVDGYHSPNTEHSERSLERINTLRKKIIDPILTFQASSRFEDGFSISRAIYTLLTEINAYEGLVSLSNGLEEQNEPDLALKQLRTWEILIDILDQMAEGIGTDKTGVKGYKELLKIVMAGFDFGSIPGGLDQVTVGTADHIRPINPKYVFLLGLNEGKFPKAPSSGGLLNIKDRNALKAAGLNFPNHSKMQAVREQLIAYQALTCSSEGLYISYPKMNLSGEPFNKSVIVSQCMQMFGDIKIKTPEELDRDFEVVSQAFDYLARNFNVNSQKTASLKEYFKNHPDFKEKFSKIQTINEHNPLKFQNPEKVQNLYHENIALSATQIENFYSCKFKYFCKYGLKLKSRRVSEIDGGGFGTLVHYILEKALPKLMEIGFEKVTDADIAAFSNEAATDYVNEFMGGMKNKPQSFLYRLERINHSSCELLSHIRQEFLQGKFVPVAFEMKIGEDIIPIQKTLPNGQSFFITGKVDRVDKLESDGKVYLRIVDYKTANKDFTLYEAMYGINTQMLIYLDNIYKNGQKLFGEIIPAGVLYHPSVSPAPKNSRHDGDGLVANTRLKEMAMNGLILDDQNVINAMEAEANKGLFLSSSKTQKENYVNLSVLLKIMQKIESQMEEMVNSLFEGDVDAIPLVSGEYNHPCTYCDFSQICGREEEDPETLITKKSKEEILKMLEEQN